MRKPFSLLFLCVFGVSLSACSGSYKHTLNFNPSEPLRVAVLPFLAVDEGGKPVLLESRLLIDNLSLVSTDQPQTPLQIVRKEVITGLSDSGLDLVSTALIDIDLPHHGFALADGSLDTAKLWATNPKELCTAFLNCDAVLYGKVTRWDRTYYGIQSNNTVGVNLKMVAAKDGKVLFESRAEDSESRGVTKGPTGFSSLLIEPVKGLDSQIIVDLSRTTVRKMLAPLRTTNRPKFLETAPPSIYAASHDAVNGKVAPSRRLVVVMYGTGDSAATFSIGSVVSGLPMVESSPGHYYGEFLPLPGEKFDPQTITVRLSDQFGRSTEQPLLERLVRLEAGGK